MRKAIETLKNIWKIEDLRQRILITILFVAIYRFGSYVVLPGINPSMLTQLHQQTSEGLLALLNMFSGGAFSNASIFALGIMPYISASIVIQLLGIAVPPLNSLSSASSFAFALARQSTNSTVVVVCVVESILSSYQKKLSCPPLPSENTGSCSGALCGFLAAFGFSVFFGFSRFLGASGDFCGSDFGASATRSFLIG